MGQNEAEMGKICPRVLRYSLAGQPADGPPAVEDIQRHGQQPGIGGLYEPDFHGGDVPPPHLARKAGLGPPYDGWLSRASHNPPPMLFPIHGPQAVRGCLSLL